MASVSVRKRKNSWEYRVYFGCIDGKSKRSSKSGFRSKKEAREAGEALIREFMNTPQPTHVVTNTMTFKEYLDFWMENYCRVNLKETTVYNYSKQLSDIIVPRIGHYKLFLLTPMILQTFINDVFNAGYGRNQLSCLKGILTSSLRYAVSPAGFLQTSPASVLRLPNPRAKPKVPTRKRLRQPITTAQWQQLMARFPREHPSHIPLNLGYHLGMRLGEVFGLCWEDIGLVNGLVTIKRQVQYSYDRKCWYFTEPKYDSSRTITMDSELIELLKDELDRQQCAKAYFKKRYQQVYSLSAYG